MYGLPAKSVNMKREDHNKHVARRRHALIDRALFDDPLGSITFNKRKRDRGAVSINTAVVHRTARLS